MKAGAWWPIALVGFLGVNVIANGILLWAARDPGGAAVEPDYYRRAVAWDSTLTLQRRSDALGWRLEATLDRPGAAGAELRVRLTDRDGVPVSGVVIHVEAIHNLESEHRVSAVLGDPLRPAVPDESGRYALLLPVRRPGLWELRFEVRRGDERFFASLRREAGGGPAR